MTTIHRRSAIHGLCAGMLALCLLSTENSSAAEPPRDLACAAYAFDTPLTELRLKERVLPPCAESVTQSAADFPNHNRFTTLQHGFDMYSWLLFAALNSPRDPNGRFGASQPTMWESYKLIDDVMLPGGAAPDPNYDAPHKVPAVCPAPTPDKPTSLVVHMTTEAFNQPFRTGPLIDQSGNYSLNVILMNRVMFDAIVNHDHPLYSKAGQQQFSGDVNFIPGVNGTEPKTITPQQGSVPGSQLGAVMVKVSWKLLTDKDDERRFHHIWAYRHFPAGVFNGDTRAETCDIVKLGMVGFHVGHKTVTRNQWIWTTFEHVDNAPTRTDLKALSLLPPEKRPAFNFFNAACTDERQCGFNDTPPQAWDPRHPNVTFRSQIVRTNPILGDAKNLTDAVHALPQIKGTEWEHYELVSTQWPSDFGCAGDVKPGNQPDPSCAPAPPLLANTTLETYSQHDIGGSGTAQSTSSCIGCHNNATTQHLPATASDFTFILEKAQGRTN